MGMVYDDTVKLGKFFNPSRIAFMETGSVMAAWEKHVDAWFYLSFMRMKGTTAEKFQATKELEMADRKLRFWENHTAFDRDQAMAIIAANKKTWKVSIEPKLRSK